MKETTFESRAKEAFGDVYGKIKELENKAKQLRAELDGKLSDAGQLKDQGAKLYENYGDVKNSSKAAFYDIREGVEKASQALGEALKKASYHFK